MQSGFELEIKFFDIMRNYRFSQKLNVLRNLDINYLTNILTEYLLACSLRSLESYICLPKIYFINCQALRSKYICTKSQILMDNLIT
jgi:hypothetical protein